MSLDSSQSATARASVRPIRPGRTAGRCVGSAIAAAWMLLAGVGSAAPAATATLTAPERRVILDALAGDPDFEYG